MPGGLDETNKISLKAAGQLKNESERKLEAEREKYVSVDCD